MEPIAVLEVAPPGRRAKLVPRVTSGSRCGTRTRDASETVASVGEFQRAACAWPANGQLWHLERASAPGVPDDASQSADPIVPVRAPMRSDRGSQPLAWSTDRLSARTMVPVRRQEQRDEKTLDIMLLMFGAVLLWTVLLVVEAAVSILGSAAYLVLIAAYVVIVAVVLLRRRGLRARR